jgi:nickel transport protein
LLFLIFGMFTTPALAHRVLVFAYAEGDTIHTESKFVPNTPVRQGDVQVLDQKSGKVILTGKTDNQGKFSFKIPAAAAAQKMDLRIVTGAAMGHQGEWLLKAASYLQAGKTAAASSAPAAPAAASAPAPAGKPAAVDQQLLEEVVNKALERQLGPMREQLAEMAVHRASLTDIIGGLGYIAGFFGLWAYFQSKRKKDS